MLVAHTIAQVAALADHVEAAGFLQTVRNAVLGFLAIVLLIGVAIGFFIGRAFGRRR